MSNLYLLSYMMKEVMVCVCVRAFVYFVCVLVFGGLVCMCM